MNKNWRSILFGDLKKTRDEPIMNKSEDEMTEEISDYFRPEFAVYVVATAEKLTSLKNKKIFFPHKDATEVGKFSPEEEKMDSEPDQVHAMPNF